MSIVLALVGAAAAFAPQDGAIRSAEPHRAFPVHRGEQERLLGGAAFRAFTSTDGRGWTGRFDEAQGVPRWLFGAGIPVSAGDTDAIARDVMGILERHAGLFGVVDSVLQVTNVSYSARTDTWYVDLDALREAPGAGWLPTHRGGISARIKKGNLISLEVRTAPKAPVTGSLRLSRAEAVSRAIDGGAAPGVPHTETTATPILMERPEEHDLRVTWLVSSSTAEPFGRWKAFVDAETGEVISVHNAVHYVDGQITAKHHERYPDGAALIESPVPLAWVESDGTYALTDTNGDYSIGGDGPYTTSFFGSYAVVFHYTGPSGVMTESTADMTWTTTDATQAEIDTYIFMNQVRQWGLAHAPDVDWVQGPAYAAVNLPFPYTCNAFYYGGAVYFFSAGGGCNNTGQIADVVYHEWGHGFHDYSIQSGFFDGSISEGIADTVAFLQTGDNYIAPYFFNGGGAIRDVAPNRRYPQDYDFSGYWVHDNGLIFGGSMWDLLGLLTITEGEAAAHASTSQILAGLVESGPDIPGSFVAALVADDDDGDLNNGTPHICELYDAFSQHGLSSSINADDVVLTTHEPVEAAEADAPIELTIELVSLEAGCVAVGASGAEVHYRVNGGDWQVAALDSSGSDIEGAIPGQPDGSFVEYYLTGQSDGGTDFANPTVGEVNPYTFYVGEKLEIACDDFEASDGDWNVADGTSFEWGAPLGLSTDPAGAFSGTQVWGLDLTSNGLYGNNEVNTVKSPKIETKHYTGVFLQYRRWLGVEDGADDQATITVNGDEVWTNYAGDGDQDTIDDLWRSHVVDLQGLGDQGTAKLGFSIVSGPSTQYGGWNIDDVCLYAPATPDNRLGITDFVATVTSDTSVHLSWTNPPHKPLKEVKVIRRTAAMPAGEADGEVIEEILSPDKGELVEIDDTNIQPGTTWYAVYAYDGDVWLSWTVEGWNAAQVDLVGDPEAVAELERGDGLLSSCGCATEGSSAVLPSVSAWLAALSLAGLRRRAAR